MAQSITVQDMVQDIMGQDMAQSIIVQDMGLDIIALDMVLDITVQDTGHKAQGDWAKVQEDILLEVAPHHQASLRDLTAEVTYL